MWINNKFGEKIMETKKCSKCYKEKSIEEFYNSRFSKDGFEYKCKDCFKKYNCSIKKKEIDKNYRQSEKGKNTRKEYDQSPNGKKARERYLQSSKGKDAQKRGRKNYLQTLDGRLVYLLERAKNRANKKNILFDLGTDNGFDWLLEQWNIQNGVCQLTKLKFDLITENKIYNPLSPSIDRIDSSAGYTKNNTRLISLCVNSGCSNWGETEFFEFCKRFLNPELFYNNNFIEVDKILLNSILNVRIQNAKRRANKKNLQFDLSTDWIRDQFFEQNGKCAVSNMPFSLKNQGFSVRNPWTISIDRKEPSYGYTQNNSRLICYIANNSFGNWGEEKFRPIAKAFVKNYISNKIII